MSVNILGLRLTSDDQKRSKNGQPPQRTTGVESNNSIQLRNALETGSPSFSPDMPRTRTGTVKMALNQKRLRIEMYSASGVSSTAMSIGSSAIPHFAHVPGASRIISGCIGQV